MPAVAKPKFAKEIEAEINQDFGVSILEGIPTDETEHAVRVQAVKDLFGPGSNMKDRYVKDYEQIKNYADSLKGLKQKVVYTLGVWDLPHIGHCRYLEKAKSLGDILIVGVELDQAIRIRKGPKRPVIPFKERVEMISHIRHVDLVVPVCDFDERGLSGMGLMEAIRPDTVVASARSFKEADDTEAWISRVKACAGEVIILESQAETSTSAKIRDLVIDVTQLVKDSMKDARQAVDHAFDEVLKRVDEAVRKV